MIEVLQNKNFTTRFQILVEIATAGPNINQKNIAVHLGISPQAVSEYIKQLLDDSLITANSRSSYTISFEGVNWMLKMIRDLNSFIVAATSAVKNITTCAAIAEVNIKKGQEVGLKMKDGVLYAARKKMQGARGVAAFDAQAGEDIGVSNIEGLVELTRGKITLLEVPPIQKGGSKKASITNLRKIIEGKQHIGAIGIEALVSLRRAGIEPKYLYGVGEAAIEQAKCGLSPIIVVTTDAVPELIGKLHELNLDYQIINVYQDSSINS